MSTRGWFSGRARRCLDLGKGEGIDITWLSFDLLRDGEFIEP